MATYYGTYGQKVQYLASDPTDPQTGQVWYNYTSATLKVRSVTTTGTFASATATNTPHGDQGTVGSQTATLTFGGYDDTTPPTVQTTASTEKYNGSSWTTNPSGMNSARFGMGASGNQTAAIAAAGRFAGPAAADTNVAEKWNGSSWTNIPSLNTTRGGNISYGTDTASITVGGYQNYVPTYSNAMESWNGSTWTTLPATYPTAIRQGAGSGTNTAALYFSGILPPGGYSTNASTYNGTSWTVLPASVNTARFGAAMGGTQTSAYAAGGYGSTTFTGTTEVYNGTSFSNNPTGLSNPRYAGNANVGTLTSGLVVAGRNPGALNYVESWTGPGTATTKTVTVS